MPWLLRIGPRFGTFRYRGTEERLVSFPVRNVQFESVFAQRYRRGYEPRVSTLLTHFLPRTGVFFDIGSNWGHFSLHVAAVTGRSVEIHAFEPQPSVADDLRAIVAQAGLADVVTLHHMALSNRRGDVRLSVPRGFESGLARIVTDGPTGSVPAERLDDLELPAPHVVKVDVEGHEAEVFSGAARILGESKPFVVFESTYDAAGGDASRALQVLEALGYRAFEPVWKRTTGAGPMLSRDDAAALDAEAELVLRPVGVESRPLLPKYLNLVGCHSSRVEELGLVVV
jgi:FkbM family methyltransferase